ncbi:MAG: histidinol dehydrogenase, partial [Alphaproteobacteria bacterium]
MAARLAHRDPGFGDDFARLLAGKREEAADVERDVAEILGAVRDDGDGAVIAFTRRFDGVELTPATFAITDDDMAAAEEACPDAALAAL